MAPHIRHGWMVFCAVLPQLYVLNLPAEPDESAALLKITLIGSLAFLLLFAWLNLGLPGFWLLGLGLSLNFLVIALNGGLMPIAPEAASQVHPETPPQAWLRGARVGPGSKDVVLEPAQTRLAVLSDRFLLPEWSAYRAAFSLGDVLIALGVFWLLLSSIERKEP